VTDWCDDRETVREQYAESDNLEARIALHRDYSTADVGLNPWRFDRMAERLDPDAAVLGLGAGPGYLWAENAHRVPWTVHVTDASAGMVVEARGHIHEAGDGFDLGFAVCDAASLPYRPRRFDAVTANHMLYHVPDRRRALREIRRVLRPGGYLFATTNGEAHMRAVREVMEAVHGEPIPTSSGFRLGNGRPQLERAFESVELVRYDDDLRVTEVEPLVRYALSREEFDGDDAPAIARAFAERFDDGTLEVTKEVGLFVARRAEG
jgi:SAM-dependent methyltransferase